MMQEKELEQIAGGTEVETPQCITEQYEKLEKKMEEKVPNLCKLIKYLFQTEKVKFLKDN